MFGLTKLTKLLISTSNCHTMLLLIYNIFPGILLLRKEVQWQIKLIIVAFKVFVELLALSRNVIHHLVSHLKRSSCSIIICNMKLQETNNHN